MLCSSKISRRPDKTLQKSFIKLAVSLILLSLCILSFFVFPQHIIYLAGAAILLIITCFMLTISSLNNSESAISYGGFANELINQSDFAERIENPDFECIIQNKAAGDLCKNTPILKFIEKYLAESPNNKAAFTRLQNAVAGLCSEKVVLSLLFNRQSARIFNELEYFEVSLSPIYLKKPKIFNGAFSVKRIKRETYFHWKINNITSQLNMEQIFKEESNALHDFLDDLPIGLYSIDKDFVLRYVNRSMAHLLRSEPENLAGRKLSDYISPETPLSGKNEFWFGMVNFTLSGNVSQDAYVYQTSYRQNEKNYLRGAVVYDLPSLRGNRYDISRSLDDINRLLKNFPVGIILIDSNGTILSCNNKANRLFGVSKASSPTLKDILSADNLQQTMSALQKSLRQSDPVTIELQLGSRILNLFINPHFTDGASQSNEFIIYILDVSRQKNLELQISHAQKMQAIGQFAGGVAHDFNNLLTAILGFTDLLLQRHGIGDPSFADLIQIQQNGNRASALVRQLLAFSRQQPLIPKYIDITDSLTDLSQLLKRITGEKIKLTFNHGNDLGYIKVDPNQFSQVIVNLVINAKDAMTGSGNIEISTRSEHLAEKYIFGDEVIMPGNFIVIDVRDTGCGIKPENLPRIFDPFFTTKEPTTGSGTGLGLAMVYGIVRQTEGFIKVHSVVDVGTTFSIYLPRFDTADAPQPTLNSPDVTDSAGHTVLKVKETLPTPSDINQKIIMGLNIANTIDRSHSAVSVNNRPARILFVEDEASVRIFGIRALKKKGYSVVESDSAENALEILQTDRDFDLMVTDMVLPNMSGAQLTNRVKELMPELPVILASGYSEDIARKEVNNIYDFEFIAKPYSLNVLTEKIFSVLNNRHEQ
ncbi:MAG: response regulator [Alphaproteobacteria bacterium]|nr:response regulator [Alphaproteobacteria bacterium]MBQ9235845.1 response regulator [Alphaproteobacteria bacterium]